MSTLAVVFLILLFSIAVYLIMSKIFEVKAPTLAGAEEYKLDTNQMVMNSEILNRTWQSAENTASGATLLFFIWPMIKDRTTRTGNEYATAVSVADSVVFKILTAPDASRAAMMAPAVLEIKVAGQATPVQLEIPKFPLQRWSAVAVVRQGRRFRVYVNNKLAAATMPDTMPVYDASKGLNVGDSRIGGKIAFLSVVDYPMSTEGVVDYFKGLSNSSFKPFLKSESSFALPTLSGFQISCPGGLCGSASAPLANPTSSWSSPYA